MARAMSSLPVPVSPKSTLASLAATVSTSSTLVQRRAVANDLVELQLAAVSSSDRVSPEQASL
jgi:hypothetical protein